MSNPRFAEIERLADEKEDFVSEPTQPQEQDALVIAYNAIRDGNSDRVRRAVRLQTEAAEIIADELRSGDRQRYIELAAFVHRMAYRDAEFLTVLHEHRARFERVAEGVRELYPFMAAARVGRLTRAEEEARRALDRKILSQEGVVAFYEGWVSRLGRAPPDPWPPEDSND